jgi:hypothetical protein
MRKRAVRQLENEFLNGPKRRLKQDIDKGVKKRCRNTNKKETLTPLHEPKNKLLCQSQRRGLKTLGKT